MPVEIRELIIRAVVDTRQPDEAATAPPSENDREALVQACVSETLRVLRRQKER
jgi:Family of unknown function (DUF5908)